MTVDIWKSYICTAVMKTTELVVEMRPRKNSGLYGIWTHDLCDTDRTPP